MIILLSFSFVFDCGHRLEKSGMSIAFFGSASSPSRHIKEGGGDTPFHWGLWKSSCVSAMPLFWVKIERSLAFSRRQWTSFRLIATSFLSGGNHNGMLIKCNIRYLNTKSLKIPLACTVWLQQYPHRQCLFCKSSRALTKSSLSQIWLALATARNGNSFPLHLKFWWPIILPAWSMDNMCQTSILLSQLTTTIKWLISTSGYNIIIMSGSTLANTHFIDLLIPQSLTLIATNSPLFKYTSTSPIWTHTSVVLLMLLPSIINLLACMVTGAL